jgi:hypothetical protein
LIKKTRPYPVFLAPPTNMSVPPTRSYNSFSK